MNPLGPVLMKEGLAETTSLRRLVSWVAEEGVERHQRSGVEAAVGGGTSP